MFSAAQLMDSNHGVTLDKTLPLVAHTEGLEIRSLEGSASLFSWDEYFNRVNLMTGGKNVAVDPTGYYKAMRMAGFSEAIAKKIPAKMMMEPLNYQFPKVGAVQAFVKDDKLVAFSKPSLEVISVKAMLEAVAEIGGPELLFERLSHNLNFTNCSAIIPTSFRVYDDDRIEDLGKSMKGSWNLPKKQDILFGGVNFSTSIMGEHPTEVSASIYRLICSNGMTSANEMFKWSRNTESVDFMEWFRDKIRSAIQLLSGEFERIDILKQQTLPADHRSDVLQNIFAEFGLSDKVRALVMNKLVQEPPRTMYDVVQAITNVANDEDIQDSPLLVRRLQKVGGEIAARVSICSTCFSVKR